MRLPEAFNLDRGFRAAAPRFPSNLVAILVATAVGVTSGVAVVLSLEKTPNTETQPVVARTTGIIDPAGVAHSSAASPTHGADTTGVASEDASPGFSRSQPPPAETSSGRDRPAAVPRQTSTSGTGAAGSTNAQEQTQFEHNAGKQRRFAVHRRRDFSARLANGFIAAPLVRSW
jgi:hypothetical protein